MNDPTFEEIEKAARILERSGSESFFVPGRKAELEKIIHEALIDVLTHVDVSEDSP
jgi:hypothetical protein